MSRCARLLGVLILVVVSIIVVLWRLVRSGLLLIPTPCCLGGGVVTSIPAIPLLRSTIATATARSTTMGSVLILVDVGLPHFRPTPRRDIRTSTCDVVSSAAGCP